MDNDDIGFALEAKSDQLNAADLAGAEPVIKISKVTVKKGEQPISIYYEGDHGRPWKPSKGMLRILAGCWGRKSSEWVGRFAQIYCDPSVKYGGEEIGGVRIRALSNIPTQGVQFFLALNRKQRIPFHVPLLKVMDASYPDDRFSKALPVMADKMKSGEMTLQQVIAQCQKTGQLSAEQMQKLEDAAPKIIDNEDEGGEFQ